MLVSGSEFRALGLQRRPECRVLREFREGCASGSEETLRRVYVGSFGEIDEVLDQTPPGRCPLVDLSRHRAQAVSDCVS